MKEGGWGGGINGGCCGQDCTSPSPLRLCVLVLQRLRAGDDLRQLSGNLGLTGTAAHTMADRGRDSVCGRGVCVHALDKRGTARAYMQDETPASSEAT